ncbi:MAG: hydroxypyruvate isomerase family protein [Acidimicrobiia bacterium]
MRLAANLSMLWSADPFADRFASAARAGFDAVELWWPGDEDAHRLPGLTRALGVQLAALNFDAGDMPAGDRGLLSDPSAHDRFRAHVPDALEIAAACGCRRMNALVGLRDERYPRDEQLDCARAHLRWMAPLAERHGVIVLIEAVNSFENGPYLLPTTEEADDFVRSCALDNVRLLYDAYHRARQGGDVFTGLDAAWDIVAHVQIADCPGRNEPGTGDVDYERFFADLRGRGYDGFVGLEYRPTDGDTERSLAWFQRAGLLAAGSRG